MRLCGGVVVFFFLLWYVYDIFSTPRTKGALLLWTVILGVCLLFWIWLTVRRSLKPMKRLVTYVQKRDPSDFSLFSTQVFRREFALLHKLIENKGKVLSREYLTLSLYGWSEDIESNALEVHIHNLRKKFGTHLIRTVRGVGYLVEDDVEAMPHETRIN